MTMTRIPSHTIEDAPEASRELLADMVQFSPTGRLLVTAAADGNAYALAIITLLARRAGWEPGQIAALRSGAEVGQPRADALIAVVREAAGSGGRVSDGTWARALAAGWTDEDL